MKSRYRVATIFVDHQSNLGYVYLYQSTTGKETLNAKRGFEEFARSRGVKLRHYHYDNGRFADHLFKEDVKKRAKLYHTVE